MVWKKNNPGCACCGCDYFFDDFNRSNDTDVGSDYTETAGDWSISSTALLIQSSNAQLDIDVAHPTPEPDGVCGFVFYPYDIGDAVRFIFNYVDADNYYFVQAVANEADTGDFENEGRVEIWERSGGANTRLAFRPDRISVDEFSVIWIYWGAHPDGYDYIYAYTYDLLDPFSSFRRQIVEYRGATFSSDVKALGTGSLTTAMFYDQLVLYRHYESSSQGCPYATSCMVLDADVDQPDCEIIASDFDAGNDVNGVFVGDLFALRSLFDELWTFRKGVDWDIEIQHQCDDEFNVTIWATSFTAEIWRGTALGVSVPRTAGALTGDIVVNIPGTAATNFNDRTVTIRFNP